MGAGQHSNCLSHRGLDSHDVGGILLVGEMVARTIVAGYRIVNLQSGGGRSFAQSKYEDKGFAADRLLLPQAV